MYSLLDSAWFDLPNLAIISFDNSAGGSFNVTTVAENAAVLLPIVNGAVATCFQQDFCFVHVTYTTGLVTINNYGPSMLRVGFYIKLPQRSVTIINGNNQAYNLTTGHGISNLSTLTRV